MIKPIFFIIKELTKKKKLFSFLQWLFETQLWLIPV